MLSVVAPASTAARSTSIMKSSGVRVASCGLNSTSSVCSRARATPALVSASTCSSVMWSMCSMWLGLVEMNTWIRARSASRTASQQRSTSARWVRESPAMTGPFTVRAMAPTASKSPSLDTGNPASMMSTPRRASCSAISSFSATSREMPGDCSPSRSVVSKIRTRLAMVAFLSGFVGATKNLLARRRRRWGEHLCGALAAR